MEKFGIFNILSALGNLTQEKNGDTAQKNDASPAEKDNRENIPPSQPGIFTDEERMHKMLDVLERHDRISRRIDQKKK